MSAETITRDEGVADADVLRLYWQPGCSSCVKLKEYLTANEIDFMSVNILEHPDGMEPLLRRGVRSVPVLTRGDQLVFGQSLDDVAAFVGKKRDAPRLPPDVLFEKWMRFLREARALIVRIPEDHLEHKPVPERPRNVRQLGYHIFQIPESVLESVENGLADTRDISNAKYDYLRSRADLLGYADDIIARMEAWRASIDPSWFRSTLHTYYGEQPAMQVLERGTWHSGQHARQLDWVAVQLLGGEAVIPPETYEGLPMPQGIWR